VPAAQALPPRLLDSTIFRPYTTGTAARHPNSVLVRGGPASPLFRPSTTGTYTVEHIWPRSQMFLEPEFLKLTPQQQVALIAYRPNLIKFSAAMRRTWPTTIAA
jgi:hypothetical protein